jgi:hypothetical protein
LGFEAREGFQIMIKRMAVAALAMAAALTVQGPAQAASAITLAPGVLVDPNAVANGIGSGLADFDTPASVTTYGQSSPSQGPFLLGGASFSGDAILMRNPGQDALGLYAEPAGDTTQYLTVRPFVSAASGIATERVTFGGGTFGKLGLFWGSMDTYNSIEFYRDGNLVDTLTGSQAAAAIVPPANATGDQVGSQNNRYVIISAVLFDAIMLTSSQNSFELDNLAWGSPGPSGVPPTVTPLPAALPLFATGLGVIGLLARRRKKQPA